MEINVDGQDADPGASTSDTATPTTSRVRTSRCSTTTGSSRTSTIRSDDEQERSQPRVKTKRTAVRHIVEASVRIKYET
jgi:hypothetical protein